MSKCNACDETNRPDHSAELKRLNRIDGQINGIRKMIEERRYCPDIMIQVKAVRSALRSLEASLLERHMEHCVADAFAEKNADAVNGKIAELVELFKKEL